MDLEAGLPQRETGRIDRHLLAIHQLERLRHAQRAHLGQGEIHHVVTTIRTGPVGEALGHVCDAIEEVIVHHHQLVILGHHQILLQVIGAHAIGQGFGLERVLRQVTGGAAVGDHYLAFVGRQGGQGEDGPEAEGSQGERTFLHR
ncbi:hypothetical protein D3C78_1174340 [compost metagenome]